MRTLRLRLPLMVSLLIVAVLATFLVSAYRQVERTLLDAAGLRLQGSADQIASLLGQTPQRVIEFRRVAASPALREYLQAPDESHRRAAEGALAAVTSNRQTIELWNTEGKQVLSISTPPEAEALPSPPTAPRVAGVSKLFRAGDLAFSEGVAEVGELGWLVLHRPVTLSPTPDILNRLVGVNTSVLIGNQAGDLWTDFSTVVPPPAIDGSRRGVAGYVASDGKARIGALALLPGTPWAVWVESPRAFVLAPAYSFLRRMTLTALVFIATAVVLVGALSARITTPLRELTEASEAIAAGEYSRRVHVSARDEIGRLGTAFNEMTGRVQAMHRELGERAQDAREELDRFFSLSIDMLCIAGADGWFKRVNPAWEKVLGWSPAELTSAPSAEFVHPDDRALTAAESSRLAAGGVTVDFENRYRCRDGSYRWLSWKAAAQAERGLVFAAARDVTEERRAAEALREQAAALESARTEADRASQAKSVFLSRMSHDLRTPLNAILGFAQLLDIAELDEELREHVRQILSGGRHLLELIDEVLDISRIESGHLSLSLEPVNVPDVVQSAVDLVKPLAARRGITVDVMSLPGHQAVLADRQRLKQILLNLLSNAVKYNRPSVSVSVAVEPVDAGRLRIAVTDRGFGIPAAKLTLLFQPFERLGAEQTAVEGTGLGLALSKALAEAMGGTLGVTSAIDRGSTFWVELSAAAPLERETVAAMQAPTGLSDQARGGTILYIEDNLSNVRLMRGLLRQRPAVELLHAPQGDVGLTMAAEKRPQLVLLDLHLPDMSGEEVLRQLFENPATRDMPVVVMTADATPGLTRRLQAAGATAFLTKPLDINGVLNLIDEVLGDKTKI